MIGKKLYKKINELLYEIKKANIEDIGYILGNKKEIIVRNVWAGIARGVGIGIGVTFISAILVLIMQRIVKLNIPVIGEYVADIMEIVQQKKY